jgi:putative FmdB family regulatory protein
LNYNYYCSSCNNEEEKTHGMNETPEYICPKCNSKMKREFSGGAGVHYKGIGWSSNGTALAPRAKRYKVHELYGPKFMKDIIKK